MGHYIDRCITAGQIGFFGCRYDVDILNNVNIKSGCKVTSYNGVNNLKKGGASNIFTWISIVRTVLLKLGI